MTQEQRLRNLKLRIEEDSVNIFIEGDKEEIHVAYWHIQEVGDDPSVAISIANAIHLFYTNPKQLLNLLTPFLTH